MLLLYMHTYGTGRFVSSDAFIEKTTHAPRTKREPRRPDLPTDPRSVVRHRATDFVIVCVETGTAPRFTGTHRRCHLRVRGCSRDVRLPTVPKPPFDERRRPTRTTTTILARPKTENRNRTPTTTVRERRGIGPYTMRIGPSNPILLPQMP